MGQTPTKQASAPPVPTVARHRTFSSPSRSAAEPSAAWRASSPCWLPVGVEQAWSYNQGPALQAL